MSLPLRWKDLPPEQQTYLRARIAQNELLNEHYRLELAERSFHVTPESHRIVFTYRDGSVGITTPTHEALYFMTGPGGYWTGYQPGFLPELVRRKTCPILQKGHPCTAQVARDFIKAMQWGGRSVEEAWRIIGEHDCARFGTQIEIQHIDEIPTDRTRRNEWRRSANGGPIIIPDEAQAA